MKKKYMPLIIMCVVTLLLLWTIPAPAGEHDESNEATMSASQQLLQEADRLFNARRYEQSRPIYKKALAEAEKAENASDQAEALAMIARTYLVMDDKETGYTWLEKAKKKASFDKPMGWSRFLGVNGRFLWKEDKKEDAMLMFQNMFDYCNQYKLIERAIDAAHMIAIVGDAETQITWGRKGIKAAEEAGETRWLGPLWNNLGATYEEQNRDYEALEAYIKARKYHYMHGETINKAIADWAIGHMYVKIGDYANAAEWLNPILPTFEELEDSEFIGLTCKELGEIEFARKQYEKAIDYFSRAQKLLKEADMPSWDAKGYQHIVDRIAAANEKLGQ